MMMGDARRIGHLVEVEMYSYIAKVSKDCDSYNYVHSFSERPSSGCPAELLRADNHTTTDIHWHTAVQS